MRYTGPKARLCRREGINLFGTEKYARIMERRPNRPGQHGADRAGKKSEYGTQLSEKQRIKIMFGLTEKQLKDIYTKAKAEKGITAFNMLTTLELRLDNAIYRAGFARTRAQARQMANHGIFMLNGRRVDIPSIQVKVGDKIEVRPSRKDSPLFQGFKELKKDIAPNWIGVDKSKMAFEIKGMPAEDEMEVIIEMSLIIEAYSR